MLDFTTWEGERVLDHAYNVATNQYHLRLEGGRHVTVCRHLLETMTPVVYGSALYPPKSSAKLSLDSKSEMTIKDEYKRPTKEEMAEQAHMMEVAELLVELDRKVAQHDRHFGTRLTNCESVLGQVTDYSDRLVPTGRGSIHVGEEFIPYGLSVNTSGSIRFLFERAPDEDGIPAPEFNRYAGLDLDQLEDCFPAVAEEVRRVIQAASGDKCHPAFFLDQTEKRLHGKPSLIATVHDQLENGRKLINELKAEQIEQEQAGFYGQKDDFGAF